MNAFNDCSVCSAKYRGNPERVPKVMQCGHTICAQCIKKLKNPNFSQCPACLRDSKSEDPSRDIGFLQSLRLFDILMRIPINNDVKPLDIKGFEESDKPIEHAEDPHCDKSNLMNPILIDRPRERAINTKPNKVPVHPPCSLIICYLLFFYVLLQLLSLSLIICFVILFSDKDSGIYDHTGLGICLLIDFILLFVCMCIVFLGLITKSTHGEILGMVVLVFFVALLAGVAFCIWNIVVLIKEDYIFITFTHIVLILSAGYYGALTLLVVGSLVAKKIACCTRPLC